VYASARLDLAPNRRVMPFVYANAGYGVALFRNNTLQNQSFGKGGAYGDAGIGLVKHTQHKISYTISLSARYQHLSRHTTISTPTWGNVSNGGLVSTQFTGWQAIEVFRVYNFLRPSLNVGVMF
jgi:hypothetical protein